MSEIKDEWVEKAVTAWLASAHKGLIGGTNGAMRDVIGAVADDIRARALRDAADAVYGDGRAEGHFSHPLSVADWLRARADEVRR